MLKHQSEPVLVLYKSQTCGHCVELNQAWPGIVNTVKANFPAIRTAIVTAIDNTGRLPVSAKPKKIVKYNNWFPMVLLFPGNEWDESIKDDSYEMKGVRVMNSRPAGNSILHSGKFNMKYPQEFVNWLNEAMNEPEFKEVQYGTVEPQSSKVEPLTFKIPTRTLPPPQQPPQPFKKDLSNNDKYMRSGFHDDDNLDVCAMKIIPRYF